MTKIRWGVLSTARIGLNKVIPAIQVGTRGEVTAISSRHLETAQTAAARLGLQKFYGSYDALLADPEIDAIYNPLPNHLHVSWSIKALEAGKHVLCEKPIGITAEDGQRLLTATRRVPQLKAMEAFMYRHHPQWQRAYELVRTEAIGSLRAIQSVFSYFNNDAADIRNQAALGGGALLDIGCYAVSLSRWLFAAEPQRVFGVIDRDPRFETDRHASVILEFPAGTSTLLCSTQQAPYQRVQILGERGSIEIEIPFNAPPDRPCRLWWTQADGTREEVCFEVCDQYTIQAELFAEAILQDIVVPTTLEDAILNMRVLDAIVRSASSETWEQVS